MHDFRPAMRPTLRHARMGDRDAIATLMHQSVRRLCIRDYSVEQIAAMTRDFGFACPEDELIRDGTYFVVEIADRIAGCGGWSWRTQTYRMRDDDTGIETTLPHPVSGRAAIRAIFVDPELEGRGVGRLLVGAAETAARKAGFDAFEIKATLTGVPLYRKLGYRTSGLYSAKLGSGDRFSFVMMHKRDPQGDASDTGPVRDDASHRPGNQSGRVARSH